MGYIEQNLVADERIIFKGEIHWMRYARPILIIFLGVLALYWNLWAVIAGVILMLIGIFQIAYIYFGLSYAVTNKRIILKKGILNVEALEIILTKVEGVHIEQSFLGRLPRAKLSIASNILPILPSSATAFTKWCRVWTPKTLLASRNCKQTARVPNFLTRVASLS